MAPLTNRPENARVPTPGLTPTLAVQPAHAATEESLLLCTDCASTCSGVLDFTRLSKANCWRDEGWTWTSFWPPSAPSTTQTIHQLLRMAAKDLMWSQPLTLGKRHPGPSCLPHMSRGPAVPGRTTAHLSHPRPRAPGRHHRPPLQHLPSQQSTGHPPTSCLQDRGCSPPSPLSLLQA